MKIKKKTYVIGIALLLSTLLLFVPVQPAKAQFVLAYTFSPDNYGNAISIITLYLDGVHNGSMYWDSDIYPTKINTLTREVFENDNLTLDISCWLNATYAGVASLAEGKNVIRHNVSVRVVNGTEIFSKQNGTCTSELDYYAPMYHYQYQINLDFLPVSGQIYTVTVIYEVFGM